MKLADLKPGVYEVTFKGLRMFLVGPAPGSAGVAHLALEENLQGWKAGTYALITPTGGIFQFGKEVGQFEDHVTVHRQLQKGLPDDGS